MLQYFDEFYMTDDQGMIADRYREVHELLKNASWAKNRSESTTHKVIRNSLNCAVSEKNTRQLVGFARVVTDYSTVYYLNDVYIDEKFKGKGICKRFMEWIILCEDKLSGIEDSLKAKDAKVSMRNSF